MSCDKVLKTCSTGENRFFFQSIEILQKCFLFADDPEKEKDVLLSTSGLKIFIGILGTFCFLLSVLSIILIYKLRRKKKTSSFFVT